MTKSPNWYEVASQFVPSTSNGIESGNRQINDDYTFRGCWVLRPFMNKILSIVRNQVKRGYPVLWSIR